MLSLLPRLLFALVFAPLAASAAELEMEIILTPQSGSEPEDAAIRQWQQRAGAAGARADALEHLGWAYVAKARRTLDAGYYKLAEKSAAVMEARFGSSAGARLLRGHVWHNLHRFRDAEAVARQLVAERGQPEDYALWSDALMEQGRLAEAVGALQQMVNLRPGVEAYSRIAHVRWLKGDLPGATAAMEDAERASSPREAETHAWTLSRLSLYYLQAGQAPRALTVAAAAGKSAPDFPPALLACGRALLALGKTTAAVEALERAATLNPLPEYQWWLADALRAAGRTSDATMVETELKRRGEAGDPRTFALFLATRHEEPATAVRLAREELAHRADVLTHDALAWALAASGDFAAADAEMQAALAERTKDARLFLHAGEIAVGRGRREAAMAFFARAHSLAGTLTPSEHALLSRRIDAVAAVAQAD